MNNRNQIRKTLQQRRAEISAKERNSASKAIALQLLKSNFFLNSQHIACYFSHQGEVNTSEIVKEIWRLNKTCYMPVLSKKDNNHLVFKQYNKKDVCIENPFGIPEPPLDNESCAAQNLQLVLVPLVAFDSSGNRLGMGAGFYDRTFSFLADSQIKTPRLVGLAYEFQRLEKIEPETWDIPLDAVVTDKGIYTIKEGHL